ncbi:MAG: hydrogenobyrinic acid a,c-diamide synthase (glutamine-hydrolyzing) [Thermodesulfovibrionales bacterium]|nr:hydrogenobyrinic acid a,c-diamide synthase (glutamine-hydrolyzing) [Thermodesulfovibrionales bacterium]
MKDHPRLVIAGIKGSSGKTVLSIGLIAALRSKGLNVVPFKKGPDFIDAGWMSVAAKNPCYNLDTYLLPKEEVLNSFLSHAIGDIAVIEGNRGLYDGVDADGSYSTAELAKFLKSPVILVVDCTKITRTTAAIVLGCMNIDRDVLIKGVVLNQVSGSRHEAVIRSSIEKYCSLPVLGAIPRFKPGEFPERHMGLSPYQEHPNTEGVISSMRQVAAEHLDLGEILKIATEIKLITPTPKRVVRNSSPTVKVGVIRDSAFQFYYPENFEELRKKGAEIIEISAIEDLHLPDIDALYIGGGFPETNALRLAENISFKNSVRDAIEKGLPVYAECGGLMFLGDAIVVDGRKYPMTGIFPLVFEIKSSPQSHGYTILEVERQNPFYPTGIIFRGHEFHYSVAISMAENKDIYTAFKMKRGDGIKDNMDGICYKNVLATFTHIHALGVKEWAGGFISRANEFKERRS